MKALVLMYDANEIPSSESYIKYEAGILSVAVEHADTSSIFAARLGTISTKSRKFIYSYCF